MKIIDMHCHIYPDKIAEKASRATGEFYHIPVTYDGKVSTLLEAGKRAKINHYVVNSVATTPEQVHAINTYIASVVREGGGMFTGMGAMHPDSDDLERDINEIISLGLVGIKLHPDIQNFRTNDKRAMDIFEAAEGRLPVCVHLGDGRYHNSNPENIRPVLEAFPKLTVIGAHLGGWSVWDTAASELPKYENLVVDCSSSLYMLDKRKAKDIIMKYGTYRVMFGSDYPLWDPSYEVARFMTLELRESEREQILYKNASALFNIKI